MEEEKFILSDEPNTNHGGIKAMPFIIGNEAFERLGTVGITSNLMVYLTTVFNMKSVNAALLLSAFNGTTSMAPLVGAFVADSGFGRYKTLAFASISSLLGMMALTLTAAVSELHPPNCDAKKIEACVGASFSHVVYLLSSFMLLVIGAGGIRSCSLPFGLDQFNPATESGKRDIKSFFSWYYFTTTVSVVIASTFIVYMQSNVSWAIGFAIPASLMCISVVLFFLGSKLYLKVKPRGSPFTSVAQVLVSATNKRQLDLPQHHSALFNYIPVDSHEVALPYTNQFRFLDKAAIVTSEDLLDLDGSTASNPWRLCTVQQIEEVKCVLRIMPILASAIMFDTAITQAQTYVVLQALQSDRHLGSSSFFIPAASYWVVSLLTIAIFIPIYSRIVIPFIQKLTSKDSEITTLQRMGAGIVLSILAMLVSGLVEQQRRHIALTHVSGISPKVGAISSMSALWLIPQLIIGGLSEGLNCPAQFEFFYKEFPDNMRSVAGSFFYLGLGCSGYLSAFLVYMVHRITAKAPTGNWLPEDLNVGKLDYFYFLIAVLGVLNLGYFMVCARWYKYKGAATGNYGVTAEPQT